MELRSRLLHGQDDGTPWPSIGQVVSAVANAATATSHNANDVTTSGEPRNEGQSDGDRGREFAVLLSKAMLHMARAASRARWGRSWIKVSQERRAEPGEIAMRRRCDREERAYRPGTGSETEFLSTSAAQTEPGPHRYRVHMFVAPAGPVHLKCVSLNPRQMLAF